MQTERSPISRRPLSEKFEWGHSNVYVLRIFAAFEIRTRTNEESYQGR